MKKGDKTFKVLTKQEIGQVKGGSWLSSWLSSIFGSNQQGGNVFGNGNGNRNRTGGCPPPEPE